MNKTVVFLRLVEANGQLSSLMKQGFSYGQIALMIQQQEQEGYIEIGEDTIILTEKGKQYLKEHMKTGEENKTRAWILPQMVYYHTPISSEDIVLPKKI